MDFKIHIGMRKVKSVLAVFFSFLIWQLLRSFFPMLETHPIFAYVYSIVEMRESLQKTKDYGKLRIMSTIIGLVIGLSSVTFSVYLTSKISTEMLRAFVELVFILIAALCSLCVAELFKCKDFCGTAAIITVICMVSHNEESIYLYAIMRVLQTMIGVFSAMIINLFIRAKNSVQADKQL
ncbi:MAG: FUSC family protein [Clostridia bacterium]|nr:FUSC family protein [Clostridia bacterium]